MAPGNGDRSQATDHGDREQRTYPLRVDGWREIPNLVHGFLGRRHSLAPGSFTLADVGAVLRAAGEKQHTILAARQVHGTRIVAPDARALASAVWDDGLSLSALPEGDILVSASADVIVTIRTADCVPLLLVASRARAVAAVHAGWRGLLAGVVERAVEALGERYAARTAELQAAIGPSIGGCCYEFGVEPYADLRAKLGPLVEGAWRPARPFAGRVSGQEVASSADCGSSEKSGSVENRNAAKQQDGPSGHTRGHLDLPLLTRLVLERSGVPSAAISHIGPCTAEHADDLHSYRRDGPNAGRQISYIGWRS